MSAIYGKPAFQYCVFFSQCFIVEQLLTVTKLLKLTSVNSIQYG